MKEQGPIHITFKPLVTAALLAGCIGVSLPLWAQDEASDPVAMPYQGEANEGTTKGADESDDVDFFDTLDFLEEGRQEAVTEAPDGNLNIDGLPDVPTSGGLRDETPGWDIAIMRGLDKVTARVWLFEAPVNQPVMFGRLEVNVRRCDKQPPEEAPNTIAFVQVDEKKLNEDKQRVFSGWIFASSPGLNAVEHPVYDVWLIDCKMADPSAEAGIDENVETSAESDIVPADTSVTTAD